MSEMPPRVRRLALTLHVAASVGWLGAVLAFLVLALAGLAASDAQTARGAYLAMDLVARLVLVPLSVLALLSGLVQSLGTSWGLFRHHWVVAKLLITVVATLLLLLHMRPIAFLAETSAGVPLSPGDHEAVRVQLVANAAAALVALLAATLLSVVKPRGVTRYGRRKLREAAP